ncbi:MAG: radical SAM protein [Chlamydiia bacterium]|nr:radical SAM protein [Chlamydiia bacterium]
MDKKLDIIEIFTSVQGETSYTGLPTTFIRLARCNLRCSWCDTPYGFKRGAAMDFASIRAQIAAPYVCITGGEPLLQPGVFELMKVLCDEGYRLSIETGGSLDTAAIDTRVKTILDIKCPGSGMADRNLWSNLEQLRPQDEVKFVIADRADYDYAVAVCERHGLYDRVAELLFAPVFGQLEAKQLVAWILEDRLPVRLNLQTHKFIWSPDTKGV